MPVAVNDQRLAASLGADMKRTFIRRSVAEDFFTTHLFDTEKNWQIVRRVLQCIDYRQPVVVGPFPAAPRRVAALSQSSAFGAGFFALEPVKGVSPVDWWLIAPEAPYIKWFAPFVDTTDRSNLRSSPPEAGRLGKVGDGRLFVPAARTKSAGRLVVRERS